MNQLMNFLRDEEGASAVEYGLIVGLIAIAIVVTALALGGNLDALFVRANTEVQGAAAP